jgi:hypothetical protein
MTQLGRQLNPMKPRKKMPCDVLVLPAGDGCISVTFNFTLPRPLALYAHMCRPTQLPT